MPHIYTSTKHAHMDQMDLRAIKQKTIFFNCSPSSVSANLLTLSLLSFMLSLSLCADVTGTFHYTYTSLHLIGSFRWKPSVDLICDRTLEPHVLLLLTILPSTPQTPTLTPWSGKWARPGAKHFLEFLCSLYIHTSFPFKMSSKRWNTHK